VDVMVWVSPARKRSQNRGAARKILRPPTSFEPGNRGKRALIVAMALRLLRWSKSPMLLCVGPVEGTWQHVFLRMPNGTVRVVDVRVV